jgi:Methylase involved in ubiquinone/menaquinone biosynthesis
MNHRSAVKGLFDMRAESYNEYTSWRDEERILTEILRPLHTMRRNSWCLDVGGGTGRVARHGRNIAGQWLIVDLSPRMLSSAAEYGWCINADATALPIRGSSFDYIAAWSSLSFMDMPRALAEIYRVARDDAYVVVAEKVIGDYATVAPDWYQAVQRLRNPLKVEVLETSELAANMSAAGFEVLSTIEMRSQYRHDYETWLSRNGSLSNEAQRELHDLVQSRPPEVSRLGFDVVDGVARMPIAIAVCTARRSPVRTNRATVVTLAPVRMTDRLEIYVQHRNAPVLTEPDYLGSYEFPQGHMEAGESVEVTARRELMEEAGLKVRQVLSGSGFSELCSTDVVKVEATVPELVVLTEGRLHQIAMLFVVEAVEATTTAAIDNRGAWIGVEEFETIIRERRIYPLNQPMFEYLMNRLDIIRKLLEM